MSNLKPTKLTWSIGDDTCSIAVRMKTAGSDEFVSYSPGHLEDVLSGFGNVSVADRAAFIVECLKTLPAEAREKIYKYLREEFR